MKKKWKRLEPKTIGQKKVINDDDAWNIIRINEDCRESEREKYEHLFYIAKYFYYLGFSVSEYLNSPEEVDEKNMSWRRDISIYYSELEAEFQNLLIDKPYILSLQRLYPNKDIKATMQKAHDDFWHTEAGWKWKKKSKNTGKIDWRKTFENAVGMRQNTVWNPFSKQAEIASPEKIKIGL